MINTILFDLDGTLLPFDIETFMKVYFKEITTKMAEHGVEPQKLVSALLEGTHKMILNDGEKTNEAVLWDFFENECGLMKDELHPELVKFYLNEFTKVKEVCGYIEKAKEVIQILKAKGYKLVLATNPIFPRQATLHRIEWAGLHPDDFELVTTYENSSFCKPNVKYYEEIMSKIDRGADECLMVGNDVQEDLVVMKLGMKAYLITDHIINRTDEEINCDQGTFDMFFEVVKLLPPLH